jgi:hypothetical protein
MIFQEVGPNENLDARLFSSALFGLWEAGIVKMGWGKAPVCLMPVKIARRELVGSPPLAKRLNRQPRQGWRFFFGDDL